MRRIRTDTLREAFWILMMVAHASAISIIWNAIAMCGGGMRTMPPWDFLGMMLIVGMIATRPVRGHWTDHLVRTVHVYATIYCILIAQHIVDRLW